MSTLSPILDEDDYEPSQHLETQARPLRPSPRGVTVSGTSRTSSLYRPGGALDSQTTESQYINALLTPNATSSELARPACPTCIQHKCKIDDLEDNIFDLHKKIRVLEDEATANQTRLNDAENRAATHLKNMQKQQRYTSALEKRIYDLQKAKPDEVIENPFGNPYGAVDGGPEGDDIGTVAEDAVADADCAHDRVASESPSDDGEPCSGRWLDIIAERDGLESLAKFGVALGADGYPLPMRTQDYPEYHAPRENMEDIGARVSEAAFKAWRDRTDRSPSPSSSVKKAKLGHNVE